MSKNKTSRKEKSPVQLREKQLANGNKSLYLDIYQDGKRYYEFLKMYLIPEKTQLDKIHNKEVYEQADTIKHQKIIDINIGKYNLPQSKNSAKTNFLEFAKIFAEKKKVNKKGTFNER
jgi:hypothetical protein